MDVTSGRWRNIGEHPITKEDTDAQGCVLAWHIHQGCLVVEWHWAERNTMITHWMPLPSAPETAERKLLGAEGGRRRRTPEDGRIYGDGEKTE